MLQVGVGEHCVLLPAVSCQGFFCLRSVFVLEGDKKGIDSTLTLSSNLCPKWKEKEGWYIRGLPPVFISQVKLCWEDCQKSPSVCPNTTAAWELVAWSHLLELLRLLKTASLGSQWPQEQMCLQDQCRQPGISSPWVKLFARKRLNGVSSFSWQAPFFRRCPRETQYKIRNTTAMTVALWTCGVG